MVDETVQVRHRAVALEREVEALKARVAALEAALAELRREREGDGGHA